MQQTSSRISFGTESSYTGQQNPGCGDRDLDFIISEMGNHRKVLGREECLKDYISGCIENVLNVLGWGQGMKQGDQLESFYQPKGETKMVCISSLRAEPFVFLSPLLLAPRTH